MNQKPHNKPTDKPNTPDLSNIIYGRNAVIEALKSGQPIEKIYFHTSIKRESIGQLFGLAKERKISISEASNDKFANAGLRQVSHQGIFALISPVEYLELDEFIYKAPSNCIVALLDELEDPHNIGAVIRSAEVFGLSAVILPAQKSAPLTQTVVKSSAGAIFHIPIIKVGNLNSCIEDLKAAGFWIYGLEADGQLISESTQINFPAAVIVGSEGKGLRPLVRKNCDEILSIPQKGKINSLNASVAAGIVFYEVSKRVTE